MSRAQSAPRQPNQTSRKGKKAWRKNVDISEVQDGLDRLRDEMVTGGPIAEKASEDIFAFDRRGNEGVRKDYQKTHKPLKADEILAQRSVIPAVDSRKRPNSNITDEIMGPSEKRQKKNWVSNKELQRVQGTLDESNHLSSERLESGQAAIFDLWTRDDEAKDFLKSEYLEQPRSKVAPATIGRPPIAMTASGKAVKAIRSPKAGTSYNPSFTDWDALLNQEGQKVVEAEKKRLITEQMEVEYAARIAAAAQEDVASVRTDDESGWEGFESEYERSEWLNKKRPERKTQAQRNKIKRRKQAERTALHDAKMADKKKQARALEELGSSASRDKPRVGDQVAVVKDKDSSSDSGDGALLRRKRLRNVPIPERNLEVVLPDELQESLRRLKPEGNLLNDRFRHLLVNGKIEARKPVLQPKKKRVTYTEKWTHKDFQIQV